MHPPAVSVIIPTYNRPHYLREAVESVLGQSFRDFELIIVDDGSQDNTPEVGKYYAARYNNVSFISQKNAGLSAACNVGVNNASGELITSLGDDDIYLPDKLERQVALMRECDGIDACTVNYAYVGDKERIALGKEREFLFDGLSVMVRRSVYEALGGYRECFHFAEDVDFFQRFEEHYHEGFIDEVLYLYRRPHKKGNNLSNSWRHSPISSIHTYIVIQASTYYRRNGMFDPVVGGKTVEDIFSHMLLQLVDLPVALRINFLRLIRNGGRRLLAKGEGNIDNMNRIEQYLRVIGGNECWSQVRECRRWLALQSLRYGNLKSAWLFSKNSRYSVVDFGRKRG